MSMMQLIQLCRFALPPCLRISALVRDETDPDQNPVPRKREFVRNRGGPANVAKKTERHLRVLGDPRDAEGVIDGADPARDRRRSRSRRSLTEVRALEGGGEGDGGPGHSF